MYKSIENVVEVLNEILKKYCDPKLIAPYYYTSKKIPPISFKVAYDQNKHIIITFNIMSGPFGETIKLFERTYFSINNISISDLINHLFNSVTYDKSPFIFNKKGIIYKNLEII